MSRRHLAFECGGKRLMGTVDEADGATGLLIVSGGNEIRSGAFGGQATLASRIASEGFPVFRFDRRGVGDSEGENLGFRHSRDDILAAISAFRAECPQLQRVVAFGNCDAASALMLMGGKACDALVLSNPWTFEDEVHDALPPPEAVRSRYLAKLRNPSEVLRLLRGEVNFSRLVKGLASLFGKRDKPSSLAQEMLEGLRAPKEPPLILIADADRTGQAFAHQFKGYGAEMRTCEGASHAYVEPHAREWLVEQLLEVLRR